MADHCTTHHCLNARAAIIPDSALDQLVTIGAQLEAGAPIDATSVELVRLTFRPLLVELRKRRAAMNRMGLEGPDDYMRIIAQDVA